MKITISELAQRLGAKLVGDGSQPVSAVAPIEGAGKTDITFVINSSHVARLRNSQAGAVLAAEPIDGSDKAQLIVGNIQAVLIEALGIFAPESKRPQPGIDPSAVIGRGVVISPSASVGPLVVVEDGAAIGENSILGPGCSIGANSKLGGNCRLDANVVVYHNCVIGNNVVIQANTTIGSTGFGYYFVDGAHRLVPHNGNVVIEDFVEIGANCCVDRAKFGSTTIGAGTKIDNLVQIAHNVVIGKCCLIAGQAGIAGSSKLGDGVILAGHAGVTDNVEVADGTVVAAKSVVTHNIVKPNSRLFGIPATEKAHAFRTMALTRRLPELFEHVKRLGGTLNALERSRKRFRARAACIAAAAVVAAACFLMSPYREAIFDPHEYKVEQVVREYQDGNDNFYVSSSSHLEDLHTGKNVFIILDIMQASRKIAADRAQFKDSYFLISYKDFDKIKNTETLRKLLFIREVDIEGQQLVLLSTKIPPSSIKHKGHA